MRVVFTSNSLGTIQSIPFEYYLLKTNTQSAPARNTEFGGLRRVAMSMFAPRNSARQLVRFYMFHPLADIRTSLTTFDLGVLLYLFSSKTTTQAAPAKKRRIRLPWRMKVSMCKPSRGEPHRLVRVFYPLPPMETGCPRLHKQSHLPAVRLRELYKVRPERLGGLDHEFFEAYLRVAVRVRPREDPVHLLPS